MRSPIPDTVNKDQQCDYRTCFQLTTCRQCGSRWLLQELKLKCSEMGVAENSFSGVKVDGLLQVTVTPPSQRNPCDWDHVHNAVSVIYKISATLRLSITTSLSSVRHGL